MRFQNKAPGLKMIIYLTVINALIAVTHYILLIKGILPAKALGSEVPEFALSGLLFTVIPSLIAAVGFKGRKLWGWHMFILASGAYLEQMGILLYTAAKTGEISIMTIVAMYFVFFVLVSNLYLWNYRYVIDFD